MDSPGAPVSPPRDSTEREWIAVCKQPLPVGAAHDWAVRPECGGVVVFTGVVRDHSDGREGVTGLTYEAYEPAALDRLGEVAAEVTRRWPDTGRVALLHRIGDVPLGDTTVVVAVSAPHRAGAFEAARFAIDTLKATVPIWKREHWAEGSDWATCDHVLHAVEDS